MTWIDLFDKYPAQRAYGDDIVIVFMSNTCGFINKASHLEQEGNLMLKIVNKHQHLEGCRCFEHQNACSNSSMPVCC